MRNCPTFKVYWGFVPSQLHGEGRPEGAKIRLNLGRRCGTPPRAVKLANRIARSIARWFDERLAVVLGFDQRPGVVLGAHERPGVVLGFDQRPVLGAHERPGVGTISDQRLAVFIGAALFVVAGWPLLALRVPPYQDLPDHLATVCVLLDPRHYPDFVTNGWFKTNSVFIGLLFLISKALGVIPAGRIVSAFVVGAMAFSLPQFVLAFTDRRRLLIAALVMAPMAHSWFVLMGMLGFALAIPLGLWVLVLLARQNAQPTAKRAIALAVLGVLLWLTHGVVLLLVALLALIEVAVRPGPRTRAASGLALLGPLLPAALLAITSIAYHPIEARTGSWGRLDELAFQNNFLAVYSLWAQEFFGLSPLSAAGLVPAVFLAFMAARSVRAPIPMFSVYALVALGAIYLFAPHTLPGFGFVRERTLPFLWAWALVRVPAQLPRRAVAVLALATLGWSAGLAADLFRAEADLDDFTAAAPQVPERARLLTLNFEPRVSSRNTWSLLHASGMYTVLRGVKPQDLWADSPSMPIRYVHAPSYIEDPVTIRLFLGAARSPTAYCERLRHSGLPDIDCAEGWSRAWGTFWQDVQSRYDYVLLWGAPPEVTAQVPASYEKQMDSGRLKLLRVDKL
jgi:hypothetical protein